MMGHELDSTNIGDQRSWRVLLGSGLNNVSISAAPQCPLINFFVGQEILRWRSSEPKLIFLRVFNNFHPQ